MGLVVLVKIMSVLINFLLQNTNLVSDPTGLTISRTLISVLPWLLALLLKETEFMWILDSNFPVKVKTVLVV
jgi:hypothetical protein